MKESKKEFKEVTIEEYFLEEDSKVYRMWRFAGKGKWQKVLTPYKENPVVCLNQDLLTNEEENESKQRKY